MASVDDTYLLGDAAFNGKTVEVLRLLNSGLAVNSNIGDGFTALHLGSAGGSCDTVQLLIDKKADTEATNDRMATALHTATISGFTNVVELLLKNNAKVDHKGPNGQTALHVAVEKGYSEVVSKLLLWEADLGIKDDAGRTALFYAPMHVRSDIREMFETKIATGKVQAKMEAMLLLEKRQD